MARELWPLAHATLARDVHALGAARMERATRRRVGERGGFSLHLDGARAFHRRVRKRRAGEQHARVGMLRIIEQQVARIREQGYEMLRSTASTALPMNFPKINLEGASTETVTLDDRSPVIDKDLGELDLRGKSGATVIAVVRGEETPISPGANYNLSSGDVIVLLGSAEKVGRAIAIIQPEAPIGGFNA